MDEKGMVVSVGDKVIISKRNKERTVFCEYRLPAATMNNGLMKVIQIGQGFRQGRTSRSGLEFRFFDITKSIVFSFFLSGQVRHLEEDHFGPFNRI